MSIVRVGLSDSKRFAAGYDAIFGGPRKPPAKNAKLKKPAKRKPPKRR